MNPIHIILIVLASVMGGLVSLLAISAAMHSSQLSRREEQERDIEWREM